ncbi:TRAP transporter substrate-binding protein DctP [Alkalilacustris brevis]|uniref:TRAP transporter substrate-binding protein DctP n=1 Tax=Alkalilacustris brevis TaxID=2026338 RepID=UPI000E0D7A8B|nr:TRAP transporter substrate-binding protein DctP [Alkalilacustris brevis]
MTRPIYAIAFAAAVAAFPASAQEVLRAQTTLPTQHTLSQSFIKHFIDVVNADGTVQINLLGGPEVNPQDRAVQALERGLLDILWTPAAFMTGQVPEAQSMMLQNVGIDELRSNGAFDHYAGIFREKANGHFLAWSETSAGYYLYLTSEPALDDDGVVDLTGLSMRSTGAYRPIIEALNGSPVAIPAGDVPQGLDRGVIDGFGWPTVGLESIGLQESVNYRVEPPFYHLANVVLVNQDKWESLSDEAREQLSRIALEYEQASIVEMNEMGEADVAAADAAGVQAVRMEGEAADRYLSVAFEAMWDNVRGNVGDETTEEMRALIYRAD